MANYGFGKYVSISERQAVANKERSKLQKKEPEFLPVMIEGKKITKNFWGKAWNENLEKYSDFANRIARGRSYVKNGFVIGLKIVESQVEAYVVGSKKKPYYIQIHMQKANEEQYQEIINQCNENIANLAELVEGKFSPEFADLFLKQEHGLFPTPRQISFSCSCPDYASMCKHVAAVLYAIGVQVDANPLLFFRLRGINTDNLIKKVAEEKVETILEKSKNKSSRKIDDEDVEKLFGVEIN